MGSTSWLKLKYQGIVPIPKAYVRKFTQYFSANIMKNATYIGIPALIEMQHRLLLKTHLQRIYS